MKKIVLAACCAIALAVGVYHLSFLAGESSSEGAAFIASIAALIAGIAALAVSSKVTASVFVVTAWIAQIYAAAAFTLTITHFVVGAICCAGFILSVLALAAVAVVALAEEVNYQYQWTTATFGISAFAIWGAFSVRNIGWSIAIALSGATLLLLLFLILWRLTPDPGPEQ